MLLETDTIISILEACKKTGERDYFSEYEIHLSIAENNLLQGGFPSDNPKELSKYALDLAAMAVFKHKIGTNQKSVSLGDCFAQFIGRVSSGNIETQPTKTGIITDLSWNQTLELIIDMLKE